MIDNDINEIWSLKLAYVNKLAKYNRGVQNLLVDNNCLSHFLRVEPLKTKYDKESAEAFKKLIKLKQLIENWVDKGKQLKGEFKNYALNEKLSNTTFTMKKKQRLPNRRFDRSKVLSLTTWSLNGHTFVLNNYRLLFGRSTHV